MSAYGNDTMGQPYDGGLDFRCPDYIDELSEAANAVVALTALGYQLTNRHRVELSSATVLRGESVAEYSWLLSKVASRLAELVRSDLDAGRIAQIATDFYDLLVYSGDTSTHTSDERVERETAALTQFEREYTKLLPHYTADAHMIASKPNAEVQFVRAVDSVVSLTGYMTADPTVLKQHYSFDEFVGHVIEAANYLSDQLPEFADVVALRTEIGMYIARTYLK